MAREAVDTHLAVAGDIIDPRKGVGDKLKAFVKAGLFYAWWYPTRWIGWSLWPKYAGYGKLGTHLRFVERSARRLARQVFHGMLVHQAKLERKQGFLFRIVDIGMELFVMAAAVSSAHTRLKEGEANAAEAVELADMRCKNSRREVEAAFQALWSNDDVDSSKISSALLKDRYAFLEGFGFVQPSEGGKAKSSAPPERHVSAAE
jgi:hypothetical protein